MNHTNLKELNLYLSTRKGKILKIGFKLTLGKVLEAAGREEGDGWLLSEGWSLEMTAVPKGPVGDDWVKGWKEEVKNGARAIL